MLHDIDVFIRDQRLPRAESAGERAVDAQRRLRPQRAQGPVPRPGRRRRGAALAVPRRPAASGSARRRRCSVFNDLRQFKNRELPTSVDGTLPLRLDPEERQGQRDPRSGQLHRRPRRSPNPRVAARAPPAPPTHASNTLMISAEHSKTGHPLMVGGPQIGYFYPGLTLRDRHARTGPRWRGATSAPFPGYMLIGRGQDFAHTLTSAGGDIIDQYVEKLCDGERHDVRVQGPVPRRWAPSTPARSTASRSPSRPTVHGPVVGYATVGGEKVAISSKRSSYGKDTLDLLLQPPALQRPGAQRRSRS